MLSVKRTETLCLNKVVSKLLLREDRRLAIDVAHSEKGRENLRPVKSTRLSSSAPSCSNKTSSQEQL